MKDDIIVAMWDCNGLEAIVNFSEISRLKTWEALKQKDLKSNSNVQLPNINAWMLRARYNSQRHYEIYSFTIDESLTLDDIKLSFKADPQSIVDIIRSRGHCIYSDRAKRKAQIV